MKYESWIDRRCSTVFFHHAFQCHLMCLSTTCVCLVIHFAVIILKWPGETITVTVRRFNHHNTPSSNQQKMYWTLPGFCFTYSNCLFALLIFRIQKSKSWHGYCWGWRRKYKCIYSEIPKERLLFLTFIYIIILRIKFETVCHWWTLSSCRYNTLFSFIFMTQYSFFSQPGSA